MALAATSRRGLASRLSGRLHPALSHLLTPHSSDDAAISPSPLQLQPPPPLFRPPHSPLPQPSGTAARTVNPFPFSIHLAGAALSCRGFSSLPSYGAVDSRTVLTDAADAAAAPVAPASFPSEVAWIAEDSSLSVAAVQHVIDAVHSSAGLNWWLSIVVSTVLLRCVLITLSSNARKHVPVLREEFSAVKKLVDTANDERSLEEAFERSLSFLKRLGPVGFIAILTPYTFVALYFAISNMVEKVPSLKEGGAFWFTDLTTPDALYILPTIISLSIFLRLECALHYSRTKRSLETNTLEALSVLSFPLAASFPQGICCYFVTWSFMSLTLMIVLHEPAVKKLLFSKSDKPTCPSSDSDGPKGPTAEDSTCRHSEHEQPPPPETSKVSDSSIDQVRDHSDEKSEKGR